MICHRFWYEMGIDNDIRFNPEELKEIRKVSLARILCDNTEGMNKMQPQAFLTSNSGDNKEVSCDDTTNIPKLDITPFRGVGSVFTPTPTSTFTSPTPNPPTPPAGKFFFTNNSLYICLQELWIISFSVVKMTEK